MIHKTCIIDKNAKVSNTAKIGPYSVIGPNVEIKEDVEIFSHVYITGHTIVGEKTKIFPFASIGTQPQDLKYKGEKNSLFMISSHVAHDCKIGNNVVIANNVPLGGHVTIEDSVVIGGNSAVQQFTRIGRLAMIGGMTGVLKDVIPFGLSFGNRNYLKGLNLIGLRRNKYENKKIMELDQAYKKIFSSKNLHENLNKINGEYKENKLVQEVTKFISEDKKRPICSPLSV